MKEIVLGHRILLRMEDHKKEDQKSAGGIILRTEETRHEEAIVTGKQIGRAHV